jgi:hypothetical protein
MMRGWAWQTAERRGGLRLADVDLPVLVASLGPSRNSLNSEAQVRKSVIAFLAILALVSPAMAQRVSETSLPSRGVAFATYGSSSLAGSSSAAALCDLSQVSRLRTRKTVGWLVMVAGGGVALLGLRPGQGSSFKYPLLAAGIVGVGGYMRYYGNGYEQVWTNTLSAVQVGRTTRTEVTDCLGSPSATTTGNAGDVSTWIATKPGVFSGGSYRSASIAFRANVVSDVKRTDAH